MPKTKGFKISIKEVVNIGNFENIQIEAEVEVELEEGDHYTTEFQKYYQDLKQKIERRAKEIEQKATKEGRINPNIKR